MNFLYFVFEPVDFESDSFKKNAIGKVSGVKQLGYESDCIYYNQNELLYIVKDEIRRFSLCIGKDGIEKAVGDIVCHIINGTSYDFLYIKGFLLNNEFLRVAQCAKDKKFSAKVIFEPQCYPMDEVCKKMLRRCKEQEGFHAYMDFRHKISRHKKCLARLSQVADVIAVMNIPCTSLFEISAIPIYNGICVDSVEFHRNAEDSDAPISILGVVDDPETCGYSRILNGLKVYDSNSKQQIHFDIVGSNACVSKLKEKANTLRLKELVSFLGEKSEQEIGALCGTHTVAVSSLGLYKTDQVYFSPNITKIFCAAGIPFIYAYEDLSLTKEIPPFALKVANINAPLSMELVQGFVWRCRLNPRLAVIERKFAENNYDWRIVMKRILEFTATGRREV